MDSFVIEPLLLLKLFTMLLSEWRCRGDFGLLGKRLIGDIGGECKDGGDLDLADRPVLIVLF